MGVEEAMAQEAWKRAGGGDKGAVEWDHILTHIAGLATHVRTPYSVFEGDNNFAGGGGTYPYAKL